MLLQTAIRYFTPGAASLARLGLSLHRSRSVSHGSWLVSPVERLGRFWSTATPVCVDRMAAVFSLSQTELPGLTLPGSVPQRTPSSLVRAKMDCGNPDAPQSCARSPARLPTGCPPDYSSFLPAWTTRSVSFPSVETLRRALWQHASLSLPPSSHPWGDIRLWMRQHPRVFRFLGAVRGSRLRTA